MRFEETLGFSYSLKVADNELTNKMDGILKRFGLTSAQYSALSALEAAEYLTNAELARKCFVTAQTMIRITRTLEAQNLIKKSVDPVTRKSGGFVLTPKALKAVCDAHIEVNKLELAMVKGLTKKDVQSFQKALKICLKNLRDL